MTLLDAIFINNSGGRILLDELIKQLHQSEKDVFYLLDNRVKGAYDFLPVERTTYLDNSLIKRHQFYKKHRNEYSTVFCFGNIPPSLRLKATVFTYFHNMNFLYTSNEFSLIDRLKFKLKAKIIKSLNKNTDKWWVQTEEVRDQFEKFWNISKSQVEALPFYLSEIKVRGDNSQRDKNTFLFVSDGHPNKMHSQLLEAFQEVKLTYPNVKLLLTVSDQYPVLLESIEMLRKNGLDVENMGWCNKEELDILYRKAGHFIYPSIKESFGLGLIEAAQYDMKILAADLPYAKAVIEPSLTFQPQTKSSIVKAVIKALETDLPKAKLKVESKVHKIMSMLT